MQSDGEHVLTALGLAELLEVRPHHVCRCQLEPVCSCTEPFGHPGEHRCPCGARWEIEMGRAVLLAMPATAETWCPTAVMANGSAEARRREILEWVADVENRMRAAGHILNSGVPKEIFPTEQAAAQALQRWRERSGEGLRYLEIYRCRWCRLFHYGQPMTIRKGGW